MRSLVRNYLIKPTLVNRSINNMNKKIAIIGLGYVGLPLAVAFAEKYKVIGFDINKHRVRELNSGHDATLEIGDELLSSVLAFDLT